MPNLYFVSIGRLGNNIIQYMAAKLVCRAFGHTLVPWRSDIKNHIEIQDSGATEYGVSWSWFHDYLIENGMDGLKSHPIAKRDILLNGFFQHSDIYLLYRDWLRSLFTNENTEYLNFETRVCDLMCAVPRTQKEGTMTVHLRMGDFQSEPGKSFILHPRVYLEILRKLRHEEGEFPIEIISQPLGKKEEEFYVSLFDPLGVSHCYHAPPLEDHATLRCAKRAIYSNSTFAWTAAFLGDTQERYMPILNCFSDIQNLGPITSEDKIFKSEYICLELFTVPTYSKTLSGELFQGLCDSIILDKEKEQYHLHLDFYVPKQKWLFLENESWGIQNTVETLCLYADKVPQSCLRITKDIFPNLRLLLIHNGDTTPCEKSIFTLLERFEHLEIFAQNNILKHTRVHSLPMGIQNLMWREYELEKFLHLEKQYFAFSSYYGNTHPIRKELSDWLSTHPFPGLYRGEKCSQIEFWKTLFLSYFTFCPPGNAHDTHRLWESLLCGSIPIVLRTEFIDRLLETCPGLPMIVVDSYCREDWYEFLFKHAGTFKKIPSCLYIEYWRELFNSYRLRAHA